MKKKELQEWKTKKQGEIDKEIYEKRSRIAKMRIELSMGKVKNIQEIKELRQTLAQLLTIKRANEVSKVTS